MSFNNFPLAPELLRALNELGHTTPTPIQSQAIPTLLNGNDIMGLAQTGTGKTAAFTLPMLHLLNATHDATKSKRQVRALILTPTRELAAQVGESVRNYGKHLNLRSEIVFGGVSINPQIKKIKLGTDIIVATPGRLLDLVNQNVVNLSKVEILVLDEADRMLDMGFINDVKKILALLPKKRQNMLFSATLSKQIQNLASSILHNHKIIEVSNRNLTTDLVTQVVHPVDNSRKRELLSYLIGFNNWKQVLVFMRTKHKANKLCEQLCEDGLSAAALHGNKSQGARTRALEDFKSGKIRILVATDIAARGIDIEQLPHVVNFELPNVAEDYVHRIGRTGRAGVPGHAISLVCVDELSLLQDIEKFTNKTIQKEIIPGYEPDRSIKAEPINKRFNKDRSGQSDRKQYAARGNNNKAHSRSDSDRPRSTSRKITSDRSERSFTNAKPAHGTTSDKPTRSFKNAKPARGTTSDKPTRSFTNAKPARGTTSDRPTRSFANAKPARGTTSDKPTRSFTNAKPGRGTTSDRPTRSFTYAKPARGATSDKPTRSFTYAKPARGTVNEQRRSWDSDSKPNPRKASSSNTNRSAGNSARSASSNGGYKQHNSQKVSNTFGKRRARSEESDD